MWILLLYTLTALSSIDSSPHKCSAGCQKTNKVIPSLNSQRETTQFEGGSPLYWWQNSENAFGDDCSNTPEGCLFDGNTKSSLKSSNPSLRKQTLPTKSTKFHSFPKSQSASSSSVQINRRHLDSFSNLNTQFNNNQRGSSTQTHSSKINRRPNAVPALLDSYDLPTIDNPTNTAIDRNYQSESVIGLQLPTFQNNKEPFETSQIDFSFGTPFSNEKITPTIKRTEQFSFTPISKPRTPQFSPDKGSGVIHQEDIIRQISQERLRPSSLQTTQIGGFRSSEKHKQPQHQFDSHISVQAEHPVRKTPHTGSLFTSKTPFKTRQQPSSPFREPSHQTGFSTLAEPKQPQTDVNVGVLHQAKRPSIIRPQSESFSSKTPYKPQKHPSTSRKTSQPSGFSSQPKPKQPTSFSSLARPKQRQSGVHVGISQQTGHPSRKRPQPGAGFTSKTPSQPRKQPSPYGETSHHSGFSSSLKPNQPQSGVHVGISQQTGHPSRKRTQTGAVFKLKIPSHPRKQPSPHRKTSHQAVFTTLSQPKQPQTDVHVSVAHHAGRPSGKRPQTGSFSFKTPYKPHKHPLLSRKTPQSGFISLAKPKDPLPGLHVSVPHQAKRPSRKRPQTEFGFTSKTPYKPQKQPSPSRKISQQPGFSSLTRPKKPKTDVHVGLTHQTRRPSGKIPQTGFVLTSKTPQQIKKTSFDKESPQQTGFSSLARPNQPQSGVHVGISQQTRHPSLKQLTGALVKIPQTRKQPSPYRETSHQSGFTFMIKPKQPQAGVHAGISEQTGHPLRTPQGHLFTSKTPSQPRKQPSPHRKTSHHSGFSSFAKPKQPHSGVHTGISQQSEHPSRRPEGSLFTSKTPQQIKEPAFDIKSPQQTGLSSLARPKHPQSGVHVGFPQQTGHPSRKRPQGAVFTSKTPYQQRKQPSPYKETHHHSGYSSLTKPKQPQSGVHTGISLQTGHPLRRPEGSLFTSKTPSQTRKQPSPSRETSHQTGSSLSRPKQPHAPSHVHTGVSEETLKPLSYRVSAHLKSETDHPSHQETPSYSPHILSTGSEDNFPSRVRPRDENKLFAPSHPPTFLQSKPPPDLTQHEINTRFTSLSFTQPKLPVSSGPGSMGGSPMGSGGMMGGMMMMLTTLKGTTLSPRRRCSAGSYCVTRDECDLYTGFIIFSPLQLRDEEPRTPKVPTVRCSIPAEQESGICCSLPHPLIGADGKPID